MPACFICSEDVPGFIQVHAECLNPYDYEPEADGEEDGDDSEA